MRSIYVCSKVRIPPHCLAIIQKASLIETHELHESYRNKDRAALSLAVRLVKCGQPFTLIRNMVAVDSLDSCVAICLRLSIRQYQAVSD